MNGDLINQSCSATFRPANHHYDKKTGTAGPGQINVSVHRQERTIPAGRRAWQHRRGLFARVDQAAAQVTAIEGIDGGMNQKSVVGSSFGLHALIH